MCCFRTVGSQPQIHWLAAGARLLLAAVAAASGRGVRSGWTAADSAPSAWQAHVAAAAAVGGRSLAVPSRSSSGP